MGTTPPPRAARPVVALAAALALLTGPGCSWIVSRRPPPGPIDPHAPLPCTEDYAAPVLDTVGAGFFGIAGLITTVAGTAYAAGACPGCYTGSKAVPVSLGAAMLAGMAVYGISANHGYRTVEACLEVVDLRDACLSGVEASCAALRDRPGPALGPPAASPPAAGPPAAGPAAPVNP
jgi:hypothetical protein